MRFFFGLHHPSDARHFGAAFLSVNALRRRKWMAATDWILDSGAFTEISRHGEYRHGVEEHGREVLRWSAPGATTGKLLAAVCQDYMCEPAIVEKTGLSVERHQEKTIERYDALVSFLDGAAPKELRAPVLPVLQGYAPEDYVRHLSMYGTRLERGAWVGVGSVCKRNGSVRSILDVLIAIKDARPDLQLHGFGLKTNALSSPVVRCLLATADSMAWSFDARMKGRDGNDPEEAAKWGRRFGVNRDGYCRESWRTIGVNEAEEWQTPRELWSSGYEELQDEELQDEESEAA